MRDDGDILSMNMKCIPIDCNLHLFEHEYGRELIICKMNPLRYNCLTVK